MRKRRNYVANHAKQESVDNKDIRNLFRQFVSIKVAEGVSGGTVKQYEENFRFFHEYIERHGNDFSVDLVTSEFIREWITYMQFDHIQYRKVATRKVKEVGLKPATINTRIKTIRVMFNTLYNERLITNNPIDRIKNVYEPEEPIVILSDKEIVRLLGVMDKSYYTVYRDYVLTILLLDTMLRVTEAVSLKYDDINRESGVIIVRASIAKSRKSRAVPVSDRTLRLLDELMKENDHQYRSSYVFATGEDSFYDRHTYNQRLKNYAASAHIRKNVHPHLFRHTAATSWLENGGGMEELRMILGHSKYDMVKRYAHVSSKSIVKAAKEYSITTKLDVY